MNLKQLIAVALAALISLSAHAKGMGLSNSIFTAAQQGDVATLQNFFATATNAPSIVDELFRTAVLAGQKNATEYLLSQGAHLKKNGSTDFNLLSELALNGTRDDLKCAEIAKVLIAHGAEVDSTDSYHSTPLVRAVEARKSQMARVLLEHGANPVARATGWSTGGSTVLHRAVQNNDKDMVAVLLEFKAPLNAVNSEGWTALDMAEGREQTEIVALLRAANPDIAKNAPVYSPAPSKEDARAVAKRIANGEDQAFEEFMSTMAKLSAEIKNYQAERGRGMVLNGRTYEFAKALGEEAAKGNNRALEALKKCLRPLTALNGEVPDILGDAAAAGNKDALEILLHYKDWDILESSAWFAICKPVQANFAPAVEESTKWLLSLKGMERNSGMADSMTNALVIAAGKGNQTAKDALQKFLASAPPPEETHTSFRMPQRDPNIPAHWSFLIGDQPLLNRILASTNLINAADDNHETALAWAVKARKYEIARALLEHGAKIPAPVLPPTNYYGMGDEFREMNMERVPMLWAVTHRDKDAVTLLLEFKAPLDAVDQDGKTLLHYAVEATNIEMIQLLLDAKAPVDAVTKDGATPLLIAETMENEDLVKMLRQAGAASVSSAPIPTSRKMHEIADRICAGDPASFDELAKAADDLYNGVDVRKNDARRKLGNTRMNAAFAVLNDAAAHGNDSAFQALKKCLSQPNAFLKGGAPYSLGKVATAGNAQALDILVNYQKWGINQISAYFALTEAAKANMEPAVDMFIALSSDSAAAKKQYYGIAWLVKEVLTSAAAQGNQKAQAALDKFIAASAQAKN
jgi:ankyrin repeat protein